MIRVPLYRSRSSFQARRHSTKTLELSDEFTQAFGKVIEQDQFIKKTVQVLNTQGFYNHNTLPCVNLCRDELCTPLLTSIDAQWRAPELPNHPNTFFLGSLAGMVLSGKTAFGAALSHAPRDTSGVHRFVLYVFPHIGFNEKGQLGTVKRVSLGDDDTTCCGALAAIKSQLDSGNFNTDLDPNDLELTEAKRRLVGAMEQPSTKSLAELTKIAHRVAVRDAEKAIDAVVSASPLTFEYALVSGVQVHGPGPKPENYIWPSVSYAVTGKRKNNLSWT